MSTPQGPPSSVPGFSETELGALFQYIQVRLPQPKQTAVVAATSFPTTTTDGTPAVLTDSLSAPTFWWTFTYNAATSSWLFTGGAPAYVAVETSETTSSTFPADLSTAGPSFTVPAAGAYLLGYGFSGSQPSSGSFTAVGGPKIGSAAAALADAVQVAVPSPGNELVAVSRFKVFSGLSAATVVKLQFGSSSTGTSGFALRWLTVTPVALT